MNDELNTQQASSVQKPKTEGASDFDQAMQDLVSAGYVQKVSDSQVKLTEEGIKLAQLVDKITAYRKLKAEVDVLTKQMEALKSEIYAIVEVEGKYQDEQGYARIITKDESPSYPGAQVDQLVTTWCKSDNDIMKSCGQMLLTMRKISSGYSYIQIK